MQANRRSRNGVRSSAANAIASQRTWRRLILRPPQQLRQLGDIDGDAAGFVTGEPIQDPFWISYPHFGTPW
jgi:hypothetical protein